MRFGSVHDDVLVDRLGHWLNSAEGPVTLLLDQALRSIHCDMPEPLFADPRMVAKAALARGHWSALPETRLMVLFPPFCFSKDLADQDRSVAPFTALGNDKLLDYGARHRDIIRLFSRFPHCTAIPGYEAVSEADFPQHRARPVRPPWR